MVFSSFGCIFLARFVAVEMPSFELFKPDPVRTRLLVYFLLLLPGKLPIL